MRLVHLLAFTLLCSLTSQAAAASRESVETLLSEIGMSKTWDASMDAMFDSAERTVAARKSAAPDTSQRQVRVDAAMARVRQLLRSVDMSWNVIGPDFVQMYVDQFSQEDIDTMVAFYASEPGRAFIAKGSSLKGRPDQDVAELLDRRVFTQEEIDGIKAFLQSPAAKSMQVAAPQMGERIKQLAASRIERVMPQIRQILLDTEAANAAEAASAPRR